MMRLISVLLLGVCACVVYVTMWSSWSVYEVVLVPSVDTLVAVTMMRVLLFLLNVCMLRECDGDGNTGVGAGGDVVAVSAGCEYMGGTRGSGFVSSAER